MDGIDPLNPFTEEEEMYRNSVRAFLDRELEPNPQKFLDDPDYEKVFFAKAGQAGILGSMIPEDYGGPGGTDICGVILAQELGRSIGGATVGSSLGNDISTHMLVKGGSDIQKRKWCPGILSGEVTQAVPLTEPNAGSDVTAIRTSAIRNGDHYVVNGSKVFISNGNKATIFYVVAKTDPAQGSRGMSMILIEADSPGISRNRLKPMGFPAYDLAEIHFSDVRVPVQNIMLGEGRGLELMVSALSLDHIEVAARALGEAEIAFRLAYDFVRERKAFGKTIFDFQHTQFRLAEMRTEIEAGRALLHRSIIKYRSGKFDVADGAMAKLWITESSNKLIDSALQMFGGSGYMDEMPISKIYRANRLHRIYAGTSEMQKSSIAKRLDRLA